MLLCLLGTAAYLPLARRWRLIDEPNHRSAHAVVTPSSGGLAIVAAVVLSLIAAQLSGTIAADPAVAVMIGALILLCLIGAWDDRRALPVALRMPVFLLLSAVAVLACSDASAMPVWSWPLLILAFAWLLNLTNFMDGIDGLAALQTLLVAGGMTVLGIAGGAEEDFVTLCVIVAGAYGGFLFFNWPPAKLFMGDAGSLSAGFLMGWLGLWTWQGGDLSPVAWFLLMSPFLLDTGITLVERALHGEPLTQAHSRHCYQRLARHWGSHARVDGALLLLHGCWLLPLALMTEFSSWPQWTLLVLGLFPQLFLIAKLRRLQ
ncbi:UDP-N-acetylmuramyl pentapeptide phosphotransferase/UDP-N-acetylglucosamine-1-phosphate transferase [Congregibacter litoralis KT71]|uniref:UDP-N-acetylmuramyl pentapeptide phosphotransferase/UDP-N-acetylglucosamine-1-phosphate transferase n=2 Tax=Congregibacter TaxID=393661 RepID=A4AAS6_9GAMM|nr:UDP-N-acetylmuramyl pentapeptide phosphotransferase/UDP-N-acetylglucosamine-1-phosphate transferase [Congregibacter litoralis KT71]